MNADFADFNYDFYISNFIEIYGFIREIRVYPRLIMKLYD